MKLQRSRIAVRNRIVAALNAVCMSDDIKVTNTRTYGTIRLTPKKVTGIPKVKLVIKVDNYIVYMKDLKGNVTAGIMSVRDLEDAKKFVKWYVLMLELAAYRRD